MGSPESSAIVARKHELRGALRRQRAAITPEQGRAWSGALTSRLVADSRWQNARVIAGFVGVQGEPDTRGLLEDALSQGKALWLPRVASLAPAVLEFLPVRSLDDLVLGSFGLLEPAPVAPRRSTMQNNLPVDLELMLMPGLAFDRSGHRLGFGRGFYDGALQDVRGRDFPVRIGVAFEAFLDPRPHALPVEAHDVRVHAVATEAGIVECRLQRTD